MSKYGSNSLRIDFDDSGGTLRNMTQHVQTINNVEVESILEESHSFGDSWFESLATGMRRMNPVTMGGMYDDAATDGPDVVFKGVADGPSATTRTFKVTWGGTKTTEVETLIQKYGRIANRGAIHRYEVTVQPTGAVTEA